MKKRTKTGRMCGPWAAVALVLMAGCQPVPEAAVASAPSPAPTAAPDITAATTIRVASNGWHSAIVLARDDLPPGTIPEAADFPGARWLSFGWGDADYFPARAPGIGTALRAALLPTPAVILMGGLPGTPHHVWPTAEILALTVPKDGFRRLVAYIDATFDRQGGARAPPVASGLESFSRFYRATGSFHLFNTCNTWTAGALQAAGLPVEPVGTVTAEDLMTQLRRLAKRDPDTRK